MIATCEVDVQQELAGTKHPLQIKGLVLQQDLVKLVLLRWKDHKAPMLGGWISQDDQGIFTLVHFRSMCRHMPCWRALFRGFRSEDGSYVSHPTWMVQHLSPLDGEGVVSSRKDAPTLDITLISLDRLSLEVKDHSLR